MSDDRLTTPPRWCPDATPTKRGWADPRTGELLISMKGLVIPDEAPEKAPEPVSIKSEPAVPMEPTPETQEPEKAPEVENPEVTQEPPKPKRRRGRPPKNKTNENV